MVIRCVFIILFLSAMYLLALIIPCKDLKVKKIYFINEHISRDYENINIEF